MASSEYKNNLFNLLPQLYHTLDRNNGSLKAFLETVGETLDDMERNISELYDDSFIETCHEWIVPYIGELIGARLISDNGNRNRQEVMKTIGWRKGKGTLAVLEDVAREITGWGVRAAEFFEQTGWSQNLNHIKLDHLQSPDLRDYKTLFKLGSAENRLLHNVDIRKPSSYEGWFQIKNIGFFMSTAALSHYRKVPMRRVAGHPYHFAFDPKRYPLDIFDGETGFPLSHKTAGMERYSGFGTGKSVDVYSQGILAATPEMPEWKGSPSVSPNDAAILNLTDNDGMMPMDWRVQGGEPLKYTITAMVLFENGGNAQLDPLGHLDLSSGPLDFQKVDDGSTRPNGRLVIRITPDGDHNRAFPGMVLRLKSEDLIYSIFPGVGDLQKGIYKDRCYIYLPGFHSNTAVYCAIDRYGSAYHYHHDPGSAQPADDDLYDFTLLARPTEGNIYPSRKLTAETQPSPPIYSLAKSKAIQVVDRGQFQDTIVPAAGWTIKAWNRDNSQGGGVLRLLSTVNLKSLADKPVITALTDDTCDTPGHLVISIYREDANPVVDMELIITDEKGNAVLVYLPQVDVITGDGAYFFVAEDGATYRVNSKPVLGGIVVKRTPEPGPDGAFNRELLAKYSAGQVLPIKGKTPIQHRIPVRCDLSEYTRPLSGLLAIDPEIGRIAFAKKERPKMPISSSYYHGFSKYLGAGAYYHDYESIDEARIIRVSKRSSPDDHRHLRPPSDGVISKVKIFRTIQEAFDEVINRGGSSALKGSPWLIQIEDSEIYTENCTLNYAVPCGIILRAAQFKRPFWRGRLIWNGPADKVTPLVSIKGIMLGHSPMFRTGRFKKIQFIDCTLLRNLLLLKDIRSEEDRYPALIIDNCIIRRRISINGYCSVTIKNSAIDSRSKRSLAAPESEVEIERSTITKKVESKTIWASETIFMENVTVLNPQKGCVRYSRITPSGNILPRLYKCTKSPVTFKSNLPWKSGYLKLKRKCDDEAVHWAENGGEIGVYHDADYTLKIKNLEIKFNEYLPVGLKPVLIDV